MIGKTFFKQFNHLLFSNTIHLIRPKVMVQSRRRNRIIHNTVQASTNNSLMSQSTSIDSFFFNFNWNWNWNQDMYLKKWKVKFKLIFQNLKYEKNMQFLFFKKLIFWFLLSIHGFKWFFDFQNNWTLKFKFEVRFSFFNLIWETKNQIYLNKYLMKLVTIPLTQLQ